MKTLEYYYTKSDHYVFYKYKIDSNGITRSKKSEKELSYRLSNGYHTMSVYDNNGKRHWLSVARAVASTYLGKPPTQDHTADHVDNDQKTNNTLENIRWASKSEQSKNRTMPDTINSAFIIVKDDIELTANEWVVYLKDTLNSFKRYYNANMITHYARKKQHGFSYKEYQNLENEVWKQIKNSENKKGWWEISNKSRMKYVTKHANHVLSACCLSTSKGYPSVRINDRHQPCHILAFETFYPDIPRGDLLVLHRYDDKFDFCPENLRLGTTSDNARDAYINGKYDGTKSAQMKCASYIENVLEKEFDSQHDAAEYLRANGYPKANFTSISAVLRDKLGSAYNRTWKKV